MARRSRISRSHTVKRLLDQRVYLQTTSVREDHYEFEGESMTGSPVKNSSKSL